nr:TIGR03545 family protein [Pirellulales bacterium]
MKFPKPLAAVKSALAAMKSALATAFRSVFRWQYVVPRVVVVLAVVLTVKYGLDPFLRWAMITAGEAAIGAKVEVAEVTTSLRGGEITIMGIAAANPQKLMRNLLEAEQLRLEVDAAQLLRNRVVVHDGLIGGLQFDSERTTSGALEAAVGADAGPSALDPIISAAQGKALAWFDDLSGRVEQDLMASLATPKVIDELEKRWPEQYEALKARAEELRVKSKQIEATFREVKKNPLRNLPQLEQLQQDLAKTQAELKSTLAEIKGLPEQAKADRNAIDAARKQDERFFREHLKLANIDAGELNQYLLGETAGGYLSQTTYWIDQAQKFFPKKKMAPPSRARGTNVLFVARKQPKFLVERVKLAGEARVSGQPLTFTGELVDAASEPELHDRPLRMTIVGAGAIDGKVVVELDRRGDVPHDSLTIDVPKLLLADRTLGKADKLAVKVTPGEASIKADIHIDGDQLTGVIEVRQSSTLAADTPMLRDDRLAAVLQESLSGVDQLAATVHLSGTLKKPDLKIESNLGPQLAAGVNGAVRKYLTERKDRLVAKVQGKVDQQVAKLETRRQEAQQELLAK